MNTRTITEQEADTLCTKDESHFFDRKGAASSGKTVQKIAVALANADGGEFIIGIADEKDEPDPSKRWQGVTKIEDLNSHLQCIFDLKPSLELKYEVLRCDTKLGYALRILIEKSSSVHQTADGTVYQRYGAQSLPVKDPQKILELSFAKGATSFEDQTLRDVPPEQIVESSEINSFLNDYSPRTDALEF